jgi:hypothetical protein
MSRFRALRSFGRGFGRRLAVTVSLLLTVLILSPLADGDSRYAADAVSSHKGASSRKETDRRLLQLSEQSGSERQSAAELQSSKAELQSSERRKTESQTSRKTQASSKDSETKAPLENSSFSEKARSEKASSENASLQQKDLERPPNPLEDNRSIAEIGKEERDAENLIRLYKTSRYRRDRRLSLGRRCAWLFVFLAFLAVLYYSWRWWCWWRWGKSWYGIEIFINTSSYSRNVTSNKRIHDSDSLNEVKQYIGNKTIILYNNKNMQQKYATNLQKKKFATYIRYKSVWGNAHNDQLYDNVDRWFCLGEHEKAADNILEDEFYGFETIETESLNRLSKLKFKMFKWNDAKYTIVNTGRNESSVVISDIRCISVPLKWLFQEWILSRFAYFVRWGTADPEERKERLDIEANRQLRLDEDKRRDDRAVRLGEEGREEN